MQGGGGGVFGVSGVELWDDVATSIDDLILMTSTEFRIMLNAALCSTFNGKGLECTMPQQARSHGNADSWIQFCIDPYAFGVFLSRQRDPGTSCGVAGLSQSGRLVQREFTPGFDTRGLLTTSCMSLWATWSQLDSKSLFVSSY